VSKALWEHLKPIDWRDRKKIQPQQQSNERKNKSARVRKKHEGKESRTEKEGNYNEREIKNTSEREPE